ncbi:MAG: hypothetical protein L3J41_16990 [Melioribacteraceae bacterium]|nr:hypothetical protein [Melioribacteraceae bacterium]
MNIFRKFFFSSKTSEKNALDDNEKNLKSTNSISPTQELLLKIKGKGRAEYPFLHPTYSPGSRIPCADFTPFIKERLSKNDIKSIIEVMQGVIQGNPGLGIGDEWIEENIIDLLKLDFSEYLNFNNNEALLELKSIWILAEKSGGGREFWITERSSFTKYFSVAMACQAYKLTNDFQLLVKSANNFIKTMRKDTPYWESFPLFKIDYPSENTMPSNEFIKKYNSLTIGGRLHLFESFKNYSQSLTDCSNYSLRNFGINSLDTIEEIILSKILLIEKSVIKISPFEYLTKNELVKLLDSQNIDYRKSWNKDKLLNAINTKDPLIIDEFMHDKQKEKIIFKYKINPIFSNDVNILLKSVEETKVVYNLLSFIGSKY